MVKNKAKTTTGKKFSSKNVVAKNAPKQKATKLGIFGKVIAGFIALSYILALYAVLSTKLVPTKYLLVIVPVSLLITAGIMYANIRYQWQNVAKTILLIFLSLLVLLANSFVFVIANSTNNFFNNIGGQQYSLESYSIVTKKSNPSNLKTGQAIGYLADDQNNTAVLQEVSKKTKAKQTPFNELASLTVALDDQTVAMAVMRSALLPLLQQNYLSFYNDITVLDTFDIKVASKTTAKTDITKPFAVFIGGIDTYGQIDTTGRSDVNIVAVVNPQTRKILLVNTPRDYYVQLHGTTGVRDKLTHAGIYGVDMSRQTLEDLYGIPIAYSVRVNFTSLLNIIDTIGNVIVYSENAFTSGGYNFEVGYNQLDSKQALEFSRNRYAFENGDRTRGQNQQRVIEAIIDKLGDPRSLLKYQNVVQALGSSVQTNASKEEISAAIKQQMNTLGSWQVESIAVDGADSRNATYSMGPMQLYVMEPNQESLNAARTKIQQYLQ